MTPMGHSHGSLSTNGTVRTGTGILTFAQAIGGTAILYNGSTLGDVIAQVTSSGMHSFNPPAHFGSSGLYITISAGTAVVHTN